MTVSAHDSLVYIDVDGNVITLFPDEALALASELVTASNVANGFTTTGVFA